MESLYFGLFTVNKDSLVPSNLDQQIKASNVALIVPEDGRSNGYRPDFTIYFKGYDKPIPVEIKWKASDFNKSNQVDYIKANNGYLVVFENDSDCDVPVVVLNVKEFQDWLAIRIYSLSRDSLTSKDIAVGSSSKWLVAVRGDAGVENFRRMIAAHQNGFWAFKNSKYVMTQIFNLQRNDEMIFVFFKSSEDAMAMSAGHPDRKLCINAWAHVKIEEPYYICLDGPQAHFFEQIRTEKDVVLGVANRKWVHFTDFATTQFHDHLGIERTRGSLDHYLVSSSNQGGALTEIPQGSFDELISFLSTQSANKAA